MLGRAVDNRIQQQLVRDRDARPAQLQRGDRGQVAARAVAGHGDRAVARTEIAGTGGSPAHGVARVSYAIEGGVRMLQLIAREETANLVTTRASNGSPTPPMPAIARHRAG